MIVTVAVVLLPVLGGLLAGLAWWEERLFRSSEASSRSPDRRHLRLVVDGNRTRPRRSPAHAKRRHAA